MGRYLFKSKLDLAGSIWPKVVRCIDWKDFSLERVIRSIEWEGVSGRKILIAYISTRSHYLSMKGYIAQAGLPWHERMDERLLSKVCIGDRAEDLSVHLKGVRLGNQSLRMKGAHREGRKAVSYPRSDLGLGLGCT